MSLAVTEEQVRAALRQVLDPEIGKPIEDLGMLKGIEIEDDRVRVYVLLTIAGCPLRERIDSDVRAAAWIRRSVGNRITPMTEQVSALRSKG